MRSRNPTRLPLRRTAFALVAVPLFAPAVARAAGPQPAFEEPQMNSTIPDSPNEIRLQFKSKIQPGVSAMTITNQAGKSVALDRSHVSPDDQTMLSIGINRLPKGVYTIRWHAMDAKTRQTSQGQYHLTIRPGLP